MERLNPQQDWTTAPGEPVERPGAPLSPRFDLMGYLERIWASEAEDPSLADPRGIWNRIDGVAE